MKKKLTSLAPEKVEVSFPRKDVVKLVLHWQRRGEIRDRILAVLFLCIALSLLSKLMTSSSIETAVLKVFFLVVFYSIAFYKWRRAARMYKGYAEILLTPREVQQQLCYGNKEWGRKDQVRWRSMEGFMLEAPTAKEISITGEILPRIQVDKQQLDWGQLEVMRNWMARHYSDFYQYYSPSQIQYVEKWMGVQYQYYNNNPQVDELENDYFLEAEKDKILDIDLSQHLIEE